MDRINPAPIEYEKEYFFENYKKQYGKTYIEDFPNLKKMANRRLNTINHLLPKPYSLSPTPYTLLDIGCAYGPFLLAAKEQGYTPYGIDPAQDAVSYVQKELGINAVQGFFPPVPCLLSPSSYNIITLWYVIEHFTDCASALAEIKKILRPTGILAFSTPSYSGISGRKNIKKFLENSPGDHYTIWSPASCKKALSLAGFKVKKIKTTGHHPERFPLLGRFAKSKISPLYLLLLAASKFFNLGDTFEIYASSK